MAAGMAGYTPRGGRRLCCCDNVAPAAPLGLVTMGDLVCQVFDAAFVEQPNGRLLLDPGISLHVIGHFGHGDDRSTRAVRGVCNSSIAEKTSGKFERPGNLLCTRFNRDPFDATHMVAKITRDPPG